MGQGKGTVPRRKLFKMTVPSGVEPQGQPNDTGQQQNSGGQEQHPPYWNELQELPEHLRPVVEPTFKKWEQNVNQRFQQQAEQFKNYEPYQEYIQQYDPDSIGVAIQLATMLRDSPQELLEKLAEQLGFELDDEDFSELNPEQEYDPNVEQMSALQQAVADLAERIDSDAQSREQQSEEAEIWATLQDVDNEMQTEFGPMDMEVVLTRAATYPQQGLEDALQWYYTQYARPVNDGSQQQNNGITPPQALGGGGGLPSSQVDMNKVYSDPKAREDLVAQMLNAANQQ